MGFDSRVAIRYASLMSTRRAHHEIVDAGVEKYGSATALSAEMGADVSRQNVVDWRRRDFIPAERWTRFVELDLTTLDELAAHVAAPAKDRAA